MNRTTQFVLSPVDATPDCPVLFVKIEPDEVHNESLLSLARLDDIERLKREVRAEASEEVERLQAKVAALMEVVRQVADADNSDHSVCYQLCSYDMHWTDDDHQVMTHNAPCVVEQARALLADES